MIVPVDLVERGHAICEVRQQALVLLLDHVEGRDVRVVVRVRVDDAGHDGLAGQVDHVRARGNGDPGAHRFDLVAADDHRGVLHDPAAAVHRDHARVGEGDHSRGHRHVVLDARPVARAAPRLAITSSTGFS